MNRNRMLILAGALLCAIDAADTRVSVSLPPGTLEVIGGQSYGAGTYEVPRHVAEVLKNRGFVVEINAPPAPQTEPAARGEVQPTGNSDAANVVTTGAATTGASDPTIPELGKHDGPSPVFPDQNDQNGASADQGAQGTQKTGDLPDTFPHVDILRENEVRTYEDLSAVVDLVELNGIGDVRAEEIRNYLLATDGEAENQGAQFPRSAPNIDAYSTSAQLPDNFPGVDALRRNGVLTFGDLRKNWANLEGAGLTVDEAANVRNAASGTYDDDDQP